ncbi:SWIM zinc finger family protein [Streptomyces uncialis]|uniref:SWIM zinc finger family protein n=1 Tax=Streptomyces uncialis TaxID=1048205 RepID=UPI00380F2D29
MTQQGVRWTSERVLAMAPDVASRKAAAELGTAGPWSGTGCSDGAPAAAGPALWGLCKGSGAAPYRTVVDLRDPAGPAYSCDCVSRKVPCKHALGLLTLWSLPQGPVAPGAPPDWAVRWLGGRAGRPAGAASAPAGAPADPEAARRRAERRAERVTAGALELERRLADLMRGGLAAVEREGRAVWEETAARMVDAQAPGLAARARELGALTGSGPGWPVRVLEECALLHLLARGWLHRDTLPAPLAATVRTRVGLPSPPVGPPSRDRWLVLASYDTPDARLTTRRIWVHGTESGRTGLVLSYGAAGRAPEVSFPVGSTVDAEAVWYPGAGQSRVELTGVALGPGPCPVRPAGVGVAEAVAGYGGAVAVDPWLESCPVTVSGVRPAGSGVGWSLLGPAGGGALPLTSAFQRSPGLWRLVSVSGGADVTVFGELGFEGFRPLAVWAAPEGGLVPLV